MVGPRRAGLRAPRFLQGRVAREDRQPALPAAAPHRQGTATSTLFWILLGPFLANFSGSMPLHTRALIRTLRKASVLMPCMHRMLIGACNPFGHVVFLFFASSGRHGVERSALGLVGLAAYPAAGIGPHRHSTPSQHTRTVHTHSTRLQHAVATHGHITLSQHTVTSHCLGHGRLDGDPIIDHLCIRCGWGPVPPGRLARTLIPDRSDFEPRTATMVGEPHQEPIVLLPQNPDNLQEISVLNPACR